MGIPLLFTDTAGTPDLTVVPFPGLFLDDELFLSDDLYLDEGPVLQFVATPPDVATYGVTVTVTPVAVTFSGGTATLGGVTDFTIAVDPAPAVFAGGDATVTGQDTVVPVIPLPVTFGATEPTTSGGQLLILIPSVRELPPLRLVHLIETPSGRFFRWAEDEPDPANVPSGVRFSDTMPGGFETSDATLPRKSGMSSSDLEPLSTWNIFGAGGEKAWEGRIERTPRVSGDQVAVSPSAVGFQAALDDDKSAQLLGVDIDLGRWGTASATRRINMAGSFTSVDASAVPDQSGPSVLRTSFTGAWGAAPALPLSTAWYDAGPGLKIGLLYYSWRKGANVGLPDANFHWDAALGSDDVLSSLDATANLAGAGPGSGVLSATGPRRFAVVGFYYLFGPAGGDNVEYNVDWTSLAVFGDHGLPRYGTGTPGLLASDVVRYTVSKWAPSLATNVTPSSFVIPHLTFNDPTTASEIVKGASRFGLQDWAVWDNRTFWWNDRGATGRQWRARIGPSQLSETGPQVDRLWSSILVSYSDVDGTTKTVGPPGSGADVEDPVLVDYDPENPANKAGVTRRDLLQMGTSTPAGAVEVGRRFLQDQKLLDSSGQARFVGHVESDRGVLFPYWAVRAGDTVSFIDAADKSARRIVKTEKDHSSRTCSVDLDSPPEGLQALLERLGVVLVPLGIG